MLLLYWKGNSCLCSIREDYACIVWIDLCKNEQIGNSRLDDDDNFEQCLN